MALTGGTGFVGRHLVDHFADQGHDVVVVARGFDRRAGAVAITERPGVIVARAGVTDREGLADAFAGCDAVAHCAGINRQLGAQTYEAVHVAGTANVVAAAEESGVGRLVLMSFLRARPECGSPYHESKWAAEEIVRASMVDWTVPKPGLVYGRGDHFLDHLSHALFTFPLYVGIGDRRIRPLWIDDLVNVLGAAAQDDRRSRTTVSVLGPTEIRFDDAVRQIAAIVERRILVIRLPMAFHRILAWASEKLMDVPLVSKAQVRMLKEEVIEPVLAPDELPEGLIPSTPFSEQTIRLGLPEPGRFGRNDLRMFNKRSRPTL